MKMVYLSVMQQKNLFKKTAYKLKDIKMDYTNYKELKSKLDSLSKNWDKQQGLDAAYINVSMVGKNWRKKKAVGCKKDYYWGWIFFSTSTNSDGDGLYEKIKELCSPYKDLFVNQRQL